MAVFLITGPGACPVNIVAIAHFAVCAQNGYSLQSLHESISILSIYLYSFLFILINYFLPLF